MLAWLWGVNLLGLAEAGLGAKVASATLEVLLVVAVAYILWELVSIFVNRRLFVRDAAFPITLKNTGESTFRPHPTAPVPQHGLRGMKTNWPVS